VTWRDTVTGELTTEDAQVVVLAGGAIETPRLWLNSGLPNPNDWIGRGLTDHHPDLVVGLMPFDTGTSRGPASGARADFPGRGCLFVAGAGPASMAFIGALSDSGIAGAYDNGSTAGTAGADAVGRTLGAPLKAFLTDIDRVLAIVVITDDDVEAANRVTLSQLPGDEHGAIPRIEIGHRRRSARTMANRDFLAGKAVEILRAAGATAVARLDWPPLLFHVHSTMRIGDNAINSVLDTNGEARWLRRAFVADNSALPNGAGGVNPTLTTQALATRTAERISELYFDDHRWVNTDAPVTSIDPAVTDAVRRAGL
jgi:choline dehydrogenase-like flavoprotein